MTLYTSSILITGGTQGMGYHTTRQIAKAYPNTLVVIASRSDPQNAATSLNEALGQSNIKYMSLDLASLATVRDFAKRWEDAEYPPIQALVLNAGIQWPTGIGYTTDGIERHFGINHVGHALLFHLLAPRLTPDARVVIVASSVHDPAQKWGMDPAWTTPDEMAQPTQEREKKLTGEDRYAASKLANVLWMLALSRHAAETTAHAGKTVVAFDPGAMLGTRLTRHHPYILQLLIKHVLTRMVPFVRWAMGQQNVHLPEASADALAWLVIGDEVRGKKGIYYEGKKEQGVSTVAAEVDLQEGLWEWTIQRVANDKEERMKFAKIE